MLTYNYGSAFVLKIHLSDAFNKIHESILNSLDLLLLTRHFYKEDENIPYTFDIYELLNNTRG